jgi:hypothetical protein
MPTIWSAIAVTLTHANGVLAPCPSRRAADPTQPRFAAPYANPNAAVGA